MFTLFYKEIFEDVTFPFNYNNEVVDKDKILPYFTKIYKLPKYLEKVKLFFILFYFLVYFFFLSYFF
jgi:hypothetical protein